MSIALTLTLDRASLSLPALVIGGSAPTGDGYFIGEGGLSEPSFDVRAKYAPDSAYVPGSQLLAAVLSASTLPVGIVAQATTTAALKGLKDTLAAALFQFDYTATLTVDGVAYAYDAGPCWPAWGELTSGWAGLHMARAAVVIPVNP